MIQLKVAYSLGVVRGIVEERMPNHGDALKQLRSHLDFLQSVLVEPPTIGNQSDEDAFLDKLMKGEIP